MRKAKEVVLGNPDELRMGIEIVMGKQLLRVKADHPVRLFRFLRENAAKIYRFEGTWFAESIPFGDTLGEWSKIRHLVYSFGVPKFDRPVSAWCDKQGMAYMKHPALEMWPIKRTWEKKGA